ncbi:hypothetical protein BKA70DRAFT_858769 [Coprinopsis sp. MPI-PUGE-AT-0042]|nr:hypothetical protein BKA70DRAFT_858769 [Coprinopsis sp. MPI-PUGE-AT-0042]
MQTFAASRLVNPEGASPVLTRDQVWAGLKIKSRDPVLFRIPGAKTVKVSNDEGNKLLREMGLENGETITEEIQLYDGTIIYFDPPTVGKPRVTNTLSYNEKNELVLTYAFAGGVPGLKPGEEVPQFEPKVLNKRLGAAVETSLQVIRELVQNGTITV